MYGSALQIPRFRVPIADAHKIQKRQHTRQQLHQQRCNSNTRARSEEENQALRSGHSEGGACKGGRGGQEPPFPNCAIAGVVPQRSPRNCESHAQVVSSVSKQVTMSNASWLLPRSRTSHRQAHAASRVECGIAPTMLRLLLSACRHQPATRRGRHGWP